MRGGVATVRRTGWCCGAEQAGLIQHWYPCIPLSQRPRHGVWVVRRRELGIARRVWDLGQRRHGGGHCGGRWGLRAGGTTVESFAKLGGGGGGSVEGGKQANAQLVAALIASNTMVEMRSSAVTVLATVARSSGGRRARTVACTRPRHSDPLLPAAMCAKLPTGPSL